MPLLAILVCFEICTYGQQTGNSDCIAADTLNNLGADYMAEGEWDMAKSTLLKSIDYTIKCNPFDSSELIPALLNLGATYSQTLQYDKALELYHRAEKIHEVTPAKNLEYLSLIYDRIGRTYSAIGDYSKAEEYYNNALLLFQEIKAFSDINRNAIITLYNGLGVLSKRMKNYPQAIEQYSKAVEFSKRLNPTHLSFLYGNIANVYRETNEYRIAEQYFNQAITEKRLIHKQDSIELAVILNDYSGLLLDEKKTDEAKSIIEQAQTLCYSTREGPNPQLSEIQIHMGKYYELSGYYDKAIYWYQRSIFSLCPGEKIFIPGSESLPCDILSKQHLLVSLKALGNAYRLKFTDNDSIQWLEKSLKIYEQSIKLADIIRHGYVNNDSRLFLAENEKATLNSAIHVACNLYSLTTNDEYLHKAFEFSERSKAALLLSSIQSNTAITFGGIPQQLGNEEKNLLREISMTEVSIYEEEQKSKPNSQKLLKWKNNLLKLRSDYESLIKALEKNYPRYYQLKHRNIIVTPEELRSRLKNNYNLVEYNMADTSVFIIVINQKGIHCIEKPVNQQFNIALIGILNHLQHFDPTRHDFNQFNQFCSYSHELYKALIKPVEKHLSNDKIIIVPDEILSYLPFEMLIDQNPDLRYANYSNLSYLVKKYTLSYSYSASLLFDDPLRSRGKRNRKVLAVAPSYPYRAPDQVLSAIRQYSIEDLSPLPGAAEEVTRITGMLNGRKLVDSMATEMAFKKLAPNYGILHLAMHTLIDNQNPMYSKLVFNHWFPGQEEGLLNAYELYNMKLNARMVVLSACRSGDGILHKGEGIMSLARGFLYAGCPSLVMTLWNVEDRSSPEIMYHYYRQIKKGKTKNEALQMAKLEYLKSAEPHKKHPYYWAGYMQIGEPSAIFIPGRTITLLILMAFLIPVFVVMLYRNYRKRKTISR